MPQNRILEKQIPRQATNRQITAHRINNNSKELSSGDLRLIEIPFLMLQIIPGIRVPGKMCDAFKKSLKYS
jgi:hypothetical protein